jgi:hypothetical protein
LIADFLSPVIANQHHTDPSISTFTINTKDDNNNFEQFLDVGFGAPFSVTDSNTEFLLSLCAELGNLEFQAMVIKQTSSSVIERVSAMSSLGVDFVDECDIAEIASTFWEFSTSDLATLKAGILNSILSHPQLTMASEDFLFELISQHVESSEVSYFDLLSFVQLEFLSKANAQQYFDLVCDNFDKFNLTHWKSLQSRITGDSDSKALKNRHFCGQSFPPNSETKGIIWHLTSVCGGNVQEKKEVILTASSVHANGGTAKWEMKHAVDYNIETHFHANNNGNEWICFDFNERIIEPTHYSLCSGWHPLKNWRLEGSLDGENWTLLDEKRDNCDVKNDKSSCTFPVLSSGRIRKIRLTQTGRTHNGEAWFMLRRFEVFGNVIERPSI